MNREVALSYFDPGCAPELAAIGVTRVNEGHYHIGVVYEDPSGSSKILHLALHVDLRSDQNFERYGWLSPRVSVVQQALVSDLCALVYDRFSQGKVELQYAFEAVTKIAKDGTLSAKGPGTGFTCSTFVMALFEAHDILLIDVSTWPDPDSADERRQLEIVELIEGRVRARGTYERYAAHIKELRKSTGKAKRFKPEEVQAASVIQPPPAEYTAVHHLATTLLAQIIAHFT